MANPGYDEAYAATRVESIDGQIEAHEAAIEDLKAKRDQYAPAKKSTKKD